MEPDGCLDLGTLEVAWCCTSMRTWVWISSAHINTRWAWQIPVILDLRGWGRGSLKKAGLPCMLYQWALGVMERSCLQWVQWWIHGKTPNSKPGPCTHVLAHICTHTRTCTQTQTDRHKCTDMNTHTRTYTYLHTCMHNTDIHMKRRKGKWRKINKQRRKGSPHLHW